MYKRQLDYYDYVYSNLERLSLAYKVKGFKIDPYQEPRIMLIAPDFSQSLINRCKWLKPRIDLYRFRYLIVKKEEEELGKLIDFISVEVPPIPAREEVYTIPKILDYITVTELRKTAKDFLDEIKKWEWVKIDPVKGALSIKMKKDVFIYLYPIRDGFHIDGYSSGREVWQRLATVKSPENLKEAIHDWKKYEKLSKERFLEDKIIQGFIMHTMLVVMLLIILLLPSTYAARNFIIQNKTTGNYLFIVNGTTGNVGIGTSQPQEKLTVSGNIYVSGNIDLQGSLLNFFGSPCSTGYYITDIADDGTFTCSPIALKSGGGIESVSGELALNQSCSSGEILKFDGTNWYCASDTTGSGSAGQIAFWQDSSTLTGDNNLYWDNSNKRLGIGTTQPSYKLEITQTEKALNVSDILFVNGSSGNVGINVVQPTAKLHISSIETGATSLTGLYVYANKTYTGGSYTYLGTAKVWIGIVDPTNKKTYGIKVNATEYYEEFGTTVYGIYSFVDPNEGYAGYFDGNVIINNKLGIGTTSPSSTLHVIGGMCVESSDTGCTASSGSIKASTIYQGSNQVIDTLTAGNSITITCLLYTSPSPRD